MKTLSTVMLINNKVKLIIIARQFTKAPLWWLFHSLEGAVMADV